MRRRIWVTKVGWHVGKKGHRDLVVIFGLQMSQVFDFGGCCQRDAGLPFNTRPTLPLFSYHRDPEMSGHFGVFLCINAVETWRVAFNL